MSAFKGPKPAGQPRSLRSIVETKNNAGGFPPPAPLPQDDVDGAQYKDVAQMEPRFAPRTPGPKPF